MTQVLADLLPATNGRLLDPMAGTGRAGLIADELGMSFTGVELEPEWSAHHPNVIVGDATALPFPDGTFQAVCVSPAYGNRMADSYSGSPLDRAQLAAGAKRIRRLTYRIYLDRPLSANNGAGMQWGARYRKLHTAAWVETARVMAPGAAFVLNIKDHQRNHQRVAVADWHCGVLQSLGFTRHYTIEVDTSHFRQGQNCDARYPELVIGFTKTPGPTA